LILRAVERGEGAPGQPPLVLLHGLFGRAANFGAVQARLAERRRVLALDLRNHGASPHDAAMDYDVMAADVAAALRDLAALPCVLLGHSMGGKVAMRLALAEPEAVARLLVADIAPVTYEPHFRAFAAAMLALPTPPGMTRAAADAALASAVPDPAVRGFLLQNFRSGAQPGWSCGLREIAAALPAIEGFPASGEATYDGPVLALAGGRSDYVLPEHRPVFHALFPRVRFATLTHAGHWLHAEDPDGFVDTVEAFAGK
jgi:pimeloyl-ACP methyl ester carboxylesterase